MEQISLKKRDLDYIVEQLAEALRRDRHEYLDTIEKSRQLCVHPDTLRKAVREGRIDAIKQGESKQSRLYFTIDSRIAPYS